MLLAAPNEWIAARLILKAGLHQWALLSRSTLNDRLDYFGSTVKHGRADLKVLFDGPLMVGNLPRCL